jgi:hypothetical protein
MSTPTVHSLITELEADRFYGNVELRFEAGKVVLLKKTETIKPNNGYRDNRGKDDAAR